MTIRLIAELILFVLFMLSYAYHLTGNLVHECIGVAILSTLLVHILHNRKRLAGLFHFKAGTLGFIKLISNCLLIVSTSLVMISGVLISRDLFDLRFLGGGFGVRQLHMTAAYWTLILTAVHIGLYWKRISLWLDKFRVVSGLQRLLGKAAPVFLIVVAVLGVKASFEREIGSKLFWEQAYDFWEFGRSYLHYFWLNFIIVVMYVSLTYYSFKLIGERPNMSDYFRRKFHGVNYESIIGKRQSP